MEVSLDGREAIRRYIKAIPEAEWPARARDLTKGSSEALDAGKIDGDIYLVWRDEIDARLERHATAAVRDHDRFEGKSADFKHVNSAILAVVANLPKPVETVAPLEPDRPRRKPARPKREVRADAHFRQKQAKLAKCPADVWGWYAHAHQSALSIALLDIYDHGECVRPIKLIAQCAGISDRSVQAMLRWATERGDLKVETRICPETRRTVPSRITTESAEILDYQRWVRRREQTHPPEEPSSYVIDGPLGGEKSFALPLESAAVEPPAAPPKAVEDEPHHENETIETAVLEPPEPAQELALKVVEHPLPVEEFEDHPESPPRLTYRPSWQPAWSAKEYERRFPKPAPVPIEHHTPITDKLMAIRELVESHVRGTPPVEDTRAHKIEQPGVTVPLDDFWSRLAVKYGIPPRPKPEGST